MKFREASDTETDDVLRVHRLAFGRDDEAVLVAGLLGDPSAQPSLSLVAAVEDRIVGHALYTALGLDGPKERVACAILAPLAVLPSNQRTGVGRGLIAHGCEILAARGVQLVFVLGDPGYYTRCCFVPALPFGLRAPYAIEPEDAWMLRALSQDALGTVKGTVRCAITLAAEQYWRE